MKNLLIIICIGVILGAPSDIQPPAGSSDSHSDNYCSRGIKLKNINKQKPNRFNLISEPERKDFSTRNYTFEELNELEFDELIDLIVTLEWWEIDGLFEFSDGSYEFYSDTLRMQALFDAVEDRGNIYTPEDDLGIEVLVEVIRSGFYLAFYYEELNFLREFEFMDNTIPGIDAICNNPNFGFGTESQIRIIKAFGAYQGIGMTSIFSLSRSTEIFEDFYLNFDNYIDDWYISNALYWLGSGVQYALYTFSYNFEPDETEFYGAVDDLFNAIAQIGLYGTITSDNEWLLNNAVWWNAHIGLFMNEQLAVQFLTDVVELYGEWTAPSLEAVEMLCYLYNCEYADGTPIDEDGIIESVHNWLLPSRTTFDDETIIFKTGDAVTPEKIETLYWAMKEVKAQFHRISLNDIPLEQGNADDSLIAVIYNSPADYQYNNFLYGLSTSNGGMYIESWGTFFTYERTPQESIYTLEDLFRHEFTHYLQGRYLEPGMWWQHPIYDNERLTWFDEGEAEFIAGSSRLNGVQTRRTMVENIAWEEVDRMSLAEVVNAQYGSWAFYTYGFAFFDYMYKNRMDMFLEMIDYIKGGNGSAFDDLMNEIANDEQLNGYYQEHMDELKANQDSFSDPVTGGAYFVDTGNIEPNELLNEIELNSGLENLSIEFEESQNHSLFKITGELPYEMGNNLSDSWEGINQYSNMVIEELNNLNWNGYQTVNSWFSNPQLNSNNQWIYNINLLGKISVSVLLGDLNNDNSVDILDVIILVNHILSPAAVELDGADINGDGEVNILDVVALVNIILSI